VKNPFDDSLEETQERPKPEKEGNRLEKKTFVVKTN
jgi:hypothetical protein